MNARTVSVATAAAGITAMIFSGLTYASAAAATESARQALAASPAAPAAAAAPAAGAPFGGEDGGKKEEDKGKEDKGKEKEKEDKEDKGYHHKGYDKKEKEDKGKIIVNAQEFPAKKYECTSVVDNLVPPVQPPPGPPNRVLDAQAFHVENISKKTVLWFPTKNCSGNPVSALPPKSTQFNVPGTAVIDTQGPGPDIAVALGSFKVIPAGDDDKDHDKGHDDHDDYDWE
ncbi:hypothetical protein [Streptomyces himalayensis]|uniref:DUF4232 domain-containing protein n=1 Tax=Streptomyces himalayensis subsp. himalayensis TaxID=2756131 RepID=A0A7W0ICH1_9ACTN|nr:hypothetical protein [Streptomyces himalayensis]MBA2950538.1 hypothetical protein [Streptomyces himalayensis subsp. himalayensis]